MATATSLRSILRRRDISSAPLSALKCVSGAKTKVTGTYLSPELSIITSLRPFGTEIIGIDLGTTNSRVAVMHGETATVIRNAEGSLSTPSVVAFNHRGEVTVGARAKHQAITKTKNTVFGTKRLIGRRFDDFETQKQMRMVSYNIVKGLNGDAWVEANGKMYSPTQISAFILAKLKETAEDYLRVEVNKAVISVPCYFDAAQRQATDDAASIAGLNVTRILEEPTAAAFSYGLGLHNRDGLVAVLDLGGGTFEVSFIRIVASEYSFECQTNAQNGDTFLGGEDFDDAIVDILISEFKRTDGVNLKNDIVALQRLREAAEKAKIELSTETQTEIDLPFITTNAYGAKHLNMTLTRSKFEAQVNHLIERIKSLCKECMEDARITTNKLDEVILVGGMSRVPIVQKMVKEIFRKTPIKVVNPDEAVAMGASYYAGLFCSRESKFRPRASDFDDAYFG